MTLHDLEAFVRSQRRRAKKKGNGSAQTGGNGHALARPFAKWQPPARPAWDGRAFGKGPSSTTPQPTIGDLVLKGQSENEITNEIFYQRNPALRGQSLAGNDALARTWSDIRQNEVRPAVKRALGNWKVDPVELAMFLSQYENDSNVPASITEKFLTRGALLSLGKSLRDQVVGRWNKGKEPPLTLDQLQAVAYQLAGDQNTALLLCHNVTKAFARGSSNITWDRDPAAPSNYFDGIKTWTPKVTHARGKLVTKKSDKYGKDLPSIFYLLFLDSELGTNDPGDWYHYYVTATMAAFGAAGVLTGSSPKAKSLNIKNRIQQKVYEELVKDRLGDLERDMTDARFSGGGPYRGFVLANALSFLEGSYYGGSQDEVSRESRFHLRGARAGLAAYGAKPGKTWVWQVPKSGSVSQDELALGFTFKDKVFETLDATS